ncbi:MAG: hypothetical protein ABIR92_01950, partial [Gemmatimonadaceae bacterium]
MQRSTANLLTLTLSLATFGSAGGQPRSAPVGLKSQAWTVGGVQRTGFVALPISKSAAGAPLVLVFHGHGGTAANMSRALPIHSKWPEALVLYLQGLPSPGTIVDREGRNAGWQSAPGVMDDRDLAFVDSVLIWAKKTYPVNAKR